MLSHYLLTLYRSMTRHRLYAALNVLGLAVGIAVFLVLLLDVQFETSFEQWIPQARQIYVVRTLWRGGLGSLGDNSATMGGTLDELRGDYPQLVGTRVWDQDATLRRGAQVASEQVEVVDPTFFKVFDLALAEGDQASALATPDSVVLTQAKARQYFGSASALGRRLTLAMAGKTQTFRVAAVLRDPPKSTDLRLDFLVPLTPQREADDPAWRQWGREELSTYLRFATPAQAKAVDVDLDRFIDRHTGADLPSPPHASMTLRLKPLTALHLLSPKDAAVVATLGVVGVLTLLLAAVNYVNLATARAGLRAREVALRKVMGATPPALLAQFMAEAVITAFVSALIGVALCELALPMVNAAGGLALQLDYFRLDGPLTAALAAALAVGVGAGLYPASVLARFRPAPVLAAARTPGGGRAAGLVREGLVVFQFAIAIAFTIGTAAIISQMNFLRTADLGFHRGGLVVVSSFDNADVTPAERASLLQAWSGLPGVVAVAAGTIAPGAQDATNASSFLRPGMAGDGPTLQYVTVSPTFFQTYGAGLLAGRLLDPAHGGDDAPTPPAPGQPKLSVNDTPVRNVVINAGVLRPMGFKSAADAIGKPLLRGGVRTGGYYRKTIVGVVRDLRFLSPHEPVPPMLYEMKTGDIDSAIAGVRYADADPKAVLARLQAQWKRIAPGAPFRADTIEDKLAPYYTPDDEHGRLFTLGALLAVLIGCVGLYGLASFTTARRTKEIGIRKSLGASTADVLKLLIGQFLRPVLLANVVAWPLAYLALKGWLSGFDQHIGLNPLYFLGATAMALVIAGLTVAGQALHVARAEPARALRHE